MSDSLQKALVSVRTTAKPGSGVTVFSRKCSTTLGKGWSFDIEEPNLTGAETLLGLLASDVLGLFLELCKKQRVLIDEVEATVKAELTAPLVHLGVIGAQGEPRYQAFQLRAYIGTAAPSSTLDSLWAETLRRAPLANTLRQSADLSASYQIT
jgi:hypothetical protein